MSGVVYALSAVTSLACVVLLARAWLANHSPLLLWTAVCFAGLTLNNGLLLVDKLLGARADLSGWRTLPALAGLLALTYGLTFKTERTR